MKIIITGATGFLGRNLAEKFHEEGFEVLATGRSRDVGGELRNKGIDFRQADILDLKQLTDAFSPADCLIHCAGKSGDWGKYREFYEANVIGTRNVIQMCKNLGIKRIIFISTPSIYFTGKDRCDISEDEPLPRRQKTHYAQTKLIVETELEALQPEGFKIIIFRPRALYGPYESTFIPRIRKMAEKKQIPLINDGRALIDITYVDNFIDAVRNGLQLPDDAWNEVYNISNGDPVSVKEWFSQILAVFGLPFRPKNISESMAMTMAGIMEFFSSLSFSHQKPSMTRFSVGYLAKSMTLNIDKAKQKLNYKPQISNGEGFEKYAKWARSEDCV